MKRLLPILSLLALGVIALSSPRIAANQVQSASNPNGVKAQAAANEGPSTVEHRGARYTIHASDTLDLSFVFTPEFNQTVTVQPDGYISLKNVGECQAAGLTLSELTTSIAAAYSKILHNPAISIDLKDFEKPYFVVGGQVGKPGKFDWRGDVTLTEAIAIAGGFTEAAKTSQVLFFHRISDQWTQARIINVKEMLRSGTLREDPELQPGDMLVVPQNTLSKIKPFLPTASTGVFLNPASY
jgi:polysaccharide export outer membrane protein